MTHAKTYAFRSHITLDVYRYNVQPHQHNSILQVGKMQPALHHSHCTHKFTNMQVKWQYTYHVVLKELISQWP